MTGRLLRVTLGFLAVVVLSGCGGSGDESNGALPPSTSAELDGDRHSQPDDDHDDDAESPPAGDAPTTEPTEPETVGAGEGLIGLDLPAITVSEGDPGPDGAGRPTLRWEPVAGAVEYLVNVRIGAAAHWGVTVTVPEATVGGEGLDPAAPGVRVSPSMTWLVVALDADGFPVAQSRSHPVPS